MTTSTDPLPAGTSTRPGPDGWVTVCPGSAVGPGSGVAARVDGHQVAVFRTEDGALYALDNRDPFTGANVLARGIVGAHGDTPTVASPLRKQRFDLATGTCLDDDTVSIATHHVTQADDGLVRVRLAPTPGDDA